MKKLILFTVILSLLASFAYAQPGYGGRGQGNGPGPEFGCHPDFNMKGMGHFGQQGKGNRHHGPREGMILRLADEIGLDNAQIDKIKTAIYDHQMAMVDARADAKKAQIEVRTLMHDDDASEAMVMGAIDKASKAKANIAKLQYAQRNEIKDILTEDQQDKLKELRKSRMGRFGDDDDDDDWPNRGRRFGK